MADFDDLPTLEDDADVQDAAQALDTARDRLQTLTDELPQAKQKAERLEEEVKETRVQVSTGEATESDLKSLKADLAEAKDTLSELQKEKSAQEEAVRRLESRLDAVKDEKGNAFTEEYADVAADVVAKKVRAMRTLATALEAVGAFSSKADGNRVRNDVDLPAIPNTPSVLNEKSKSLSGGATITPESLRKRADEIEERNDRIAEEWA